MKMKKSLSKNDVQNLQALMIEAMKEDPGIIFHHSDTDLQLLKKYLVPVFAHFGKMIDSLPAPLVLIFLFQESAQESEFMSQGLDGVCTVKEAYIDKLKVKACAIGVSVEALHRPDAESYIPFVFLHELTHDTVSNNMQHDEHFHEYLDYLLMLYNDAQGTEIENDYCGLARESS